MALAAGDVPQIRGAKSVTISNPMTTPVASLPSPPQSYYALFSTDRRFERFFLKGSNVHLSVSLACPRFRNHSEDCNLPQVAQRGYGLQRVQEHVAGDQIISGVVLLIAHRSTLFTVFENGRIQVDAYDRSQQCGGRPDIYDQAFTIVDETGDGRAEFDLFDPSKSNGNYRTVLRDVENFIQKAEEASLLICEPCQQPSPKSCDGTPVC